MNAIDLLPYLGFDLDRFERHLRGDHPGLTRLDVSVTRGTGLAAWYGRLPAAVSAAPPSTR